MKLQHSQHDHSFNLSLKPYFYFGVAMISICIIGFSVWATTAPLSAASLASGKLVTEMENQTVQHHDGGVVESILVNEGQHVTKGELLMTLSDPLLVSQLDQVRQKVFIARTKLSRIDAELSAKQIKWHKPNNELTPIQLQIRADQQTLLTQNRRLLEEKIASIHQQISQLTNDSDSYRAWLTSDEKSLVLLNEEIEANSDLLEKGYVSKIAYLELQRELSSLEARIAEHKTRIKREQSKIVELGSQLDSIQIDFRRNAQQQKQELVAEELALVEQLRAATTLNDRIEIRAPVSGEIINLSIHTEGGVIAPASTILEIVPDNSRVIANVNISPKDIEAVYEGLAANVRLTSFSFRQVPAVSGELIHLSADSLVDERQGSHFYQGKISLSATELLELGLELKPGMPVEAQIVLEERTVLDYLLSPLLHAVDRGMREM